MNRIDVIGQNGNTGEHYVGIDPNTTYTLKKNKYGCQTLTLYSANCEAPAYYTEPNKKLLTIIDNGNGYTIKDHSWNSIIPTMYYNLDYGTARLIYDNLGLMLDDDAYTTGR